MSATAKKKMIQRYSAVERINHWVVAICFLLLAASGLAFFYPAFFWLTGVFGTPQLARMLHPFVGVIMFAGFIIMFFRYWHHNLPDGEDVKWAKGIRHIIMGHEVGDIGRYNLGQKGMFWLMTVCMLTLLVTGIIIWRQFFADFFPIPVIRIALLLHAASAIGLIIGIIVHVYAAIWIKGTVRAMVEGVVSRTWARKHHPRWYREVVAKEAEKRP